VYCQELRRVVGNLFKVFLGTLFIQEFRRVLGNRKGIFTRQRQPKAAAHWLRSRYLKLAEEEKQQQQQKQQLGTMEIVKEKISNFWISD